MLEENAVITGKVISIAFGGEGIIRHEGFVIFVPFVAPGDIAEVRITKCHKRHAFGTLVKVVEPSTERIAPRCPHFGICGGCQLQHLPYEAQLSHKRQNIVDTLLRVGKRTLSVPVTVAPAQQQWEYRRHVRLHLQPTSKGYIAGYVREDLNGIVLIKVCPIFVNENNPLISQLQDVVGQFESKPDNRGHVAIIKAAPDRYVFAFSFEKEIPAQAQRHIQDTLKKYPSWQGASLEDGRSRQILGNISCSFEVDGMQMAFSPQGFVQNHPEESLKLYRDMCDYAQKAGATNVLDLYCGIGVSSLLLSKLGIQVIGVEGNEATIDMAQQNATRNKLQASFIKADVSRVIQNLIQKHQPDLIIVNPPRTGLDPQTRKALTQSKPKHLIYVSCMPATLARDIEELTASGEEIIACHAYDMFPQTAHVETMVVLRNSFINKQNK